MIDNRPVYGCDGCRTTLGSLGCATHGQSRTYRAGWTARGVGVTDLLFPEIVAPDPDNKFHRGNGDDGKHYWLTPPSLYRALDAEFHFDFDPCPYPLPEGFDGLTCEWGQSNYVNPPFGSILHEGRMKGPTAWVRKAIAEHRKGKTVVLVYPIDKWVLMLLAEIGANVRNLGDVRWLATEDRSAGNGTGRHIACFVLDNHVGSRTQVPGGNQAAPGEQVPGGNREPA